MLPHEAAYVATLPSAEMYERSYMHRDTVTHVAVAQVLPLLFAITSTHLPSFAGYVQGCLMVKPVAQPMPASSHHC